MHKLQDDVKEISNKKTYYYFDEKWSLIWLSKFWYLLGFSCSANAILIRKSIIASLTGLVSLGTEQILSTIHDVLFSNFFVFLYTKGAHKCRLNPADPSKSGTNNITCKRSHRSSTLRIDFFRIVDKTRSAINISSLAWSGHWSKYFWRIWLYIDGHISANDPYCSIWSNVNCTSHFSNQKGSNAFLISSLCWSTQSNEKPPWKTLSNVFPNTWTTWFWVIVLSL